MAKQTAKKTQTSTAKAPVEPKATKVEQEQQPEIYTGKYLDRHNRVISVKGEVDPNWRYHDTVFVPKNKPRSEVNTFAHIYAIISEAGPRGMTGYELAHRLRHTPGVAKRSKYTSGELPPVGWSEDYINGALRFEGGVIDFAKSPNGNGNGAGAKEKETVEAKDKSKEEPKAE